MKQGFRNIIALCLLVAYSLSISLSIQNLIVDTVFDNGSHHDVSINLSDSKTPELSLFPDLEPLGNVLNETVLTFQNGEVKVAFQFLKQADQLLVVKDNQYLYKSKNIHPGLDIETLLYPFHTFS
ncbi:hypothetical protein [Bizionia arctica]|uniref:Uncharacterized protein n=1 Tax=Bizionia arctica TaxID=1495645 RepID=A0A917GLE8_9FLAO|nr:hypothetical protein [Bizionia arctica]GGG50319.1 hypothetical protein GCM10010976_21860 [Bizionia arctica]